MIRTSLLSVANHRMFLPLAIVFLVVWWFLSHIPIISYGTEPLPIHAAYVGDEQGPINGALHILEDRSLLALRDAHNTQYGPLISIMAVPLALADFVIYATLAGTFSPESYKNHIIWDWTGILLLGRLLALAAGASALVATYLIVRDFAGHHHRYWTVLVAVLLLALNWHFFEYATYYRHWVFVSAILLWQVYFLARLSREDGQQRRTWMILALLAILSFGISYFGIVFQALWLPFLLLWISRRRFDLLKQLFYQAVIVAVGCALIVAWVPGPFYRAIGIGYNDITKQEVGEHINEEYGTDLSFAYYAEVVGANNIALVLAITLMLVGLWRQRGSFDFLIPSSIALTAILYFVFFAVQSHHEPRYILPTIILMVLLAGLLFKAWLASAGQRRDVYYFLVLALLMFQVGFHSLHIVRASYVFSQGASEQALLKRLVPILEKEDDLKVLALRDNPFGYPHTKESYARYAERFGFADRGLFVTLTTGATYPEDLYLLDFDYFSYFHLPAAEAPRLADYDMVLVRYRPNEPDVPNERDRVDVNILNWWYPMMAREQNWVMCVSQKCLKYENSF